MTIAIDMRMAAAGLTPGGSPSTSRAAPSDVIAAAVSDSQIDLTWTDNATAEDGFYVERSPDGSTWEQIAILPANAEAFSDYGLAASTQYYYRLKAFNAGGTGSPSASANDTTDAATTPSGMALWLKSDAGTYQDTGAATPASADTDPIGRWNDQSGNGVNVTQATSGKRPTLQTNEIDSLPIVRFDGSDDWLASAAAVLGGSWTVFVVAKAPDSAQRNGVFGQFSAGSANRFYAGVHEDTASGSNSPNELGIFIDDATDLTLVANDAITTDGYYVTTWVKDATDLVRIYVNNREVASVNAGIPATVQARTLYLGAINDAVLPGELDVAEVIVYTSAVSAATRNAVANYLRDRYASLKRLLHRQALENNWNLLYPDRWAVEQFNAFVDDGGAIIASGALLGTGRHVVARAPAQGTFEVDFVTPASGDFYGAFMFNCYDNNDYWLFQVRRDSPDNIDFKLIKSVAGTTTEFHDGGTLVAANGTTYAIRIERGGGGALAVYVDNVLFTSTTDRFLQYEELMAFLYLTAYAGVRFENLTLTPAAPRSVPPVFVTFPTYEAVADRAIVSDLYVKGSDDPQQNHFLGMGIQGGHGSERQLFYDPAITRTIRVQNSVVTQVEYGGDLTHYADDSDDGDARVRITFLRDRIICMSSMTPGITDNNIGWGHDIDLFEPLMYESIRHNGSGSFVSATLAADWAVLQTGVTTPWIVQALTRINTRLIAVFNSLAGAGTNAHKWEARDTDDGFNFSFAANRYGLGSGTNYKQRVTVFIDVALVYDDIKAAAVEPDLTTPYIGVTTGTLVTSDDGDNDADGYNEEGEWYTVQAAANVVWVTFDPSGGSRTSDAYYSPVLKITSWSGGTPTVELSTNGGSSWSTLTEDVDYVQAETSGTLYVQYLGVISAVTELRIS